MHLSNEKLYSPSASVTEISLERTAKSKGTHFSVSGYFVIKTDKQIYVIETNFYSSGGSKLNETARSYKTLAQEVATIDGVTFIWFTDGCGWNSARNNLEETFDVLDTVYNIKDLEDGILQNLK